MSTGMMTHACNPNSWEAKAELKVQGLPGLHSKILSLKNKNKRQYNQVVTPSLAKVLCLLLRYKMAESVF